MQRKVFRGVGAMVVNPLTDRRFLVITKIRGGQRFEFLPQRMIEVDLGLTPSRTDWQRVRVDDRGISADRIPLPIASCLQELEGFHITSVGGPTGPNTDDLARGCLVGAVYLEDDYFQNVRDRIDLPGNPWPCDGRATYQLTSISYSNAAENGSRKNLRYHGFHARVAERKAGAVRNLELFNINGDSIGTFDLDFANPLHLDDPPELAAGEQALTADSQIDDKGAVYVELAKLAALEVTNPKLPIGQED